MDDYINDYINDYFYSIIHNLQKYIGTFPYRGIGVFLFMLGGILLQKEKFVAKW